MSASPRGHLLIAGQRLLSGRIVRLKDRHERTGLDLLSQRISGVVPDVRTADDWVDGHCESMLGAVGRVIHRLSGRLSNDEDVQVMRRRASSPEIASGP